MRIVFVVLTLLLAGCASSPSDSTSSTSEATTENQTPVKLADLTAAGCDYNDMIWVTPPDMAQQFLPSGFTPRPLLPGGMAAIVINAIDCPEPSVWQAWDMFIVVEPPEFAENMTAFDATNRTERGGDEYDLDLYMLATHTDSVELAAIMAQAGIPVGPGHPANRVQNDLDPQAAAVGQLVDGDAVLGQFALESIIDPLGNLGGHLTASHRQWHVAENGTLLIERFMSIDGAPLDVGQGPAGCVLSPDTLFFDVVGARSCNIGQASLNGMAWSGAAYWFPGVGPVTA